MSHSNDIANLELEIVTNF